MLFGILDGTKVIAQFTAPMTVKSNSPSNVSDTLSLRRYTTRARAQRWEINTGVEPLSSSANELQVHLVTKGISEAFPVRMPQPIAYIEKVKSKTPLTMGAAASNSKTIPIVGGATYLPKGTFIKFANHSKLYMLTEDVTSASTSINIFPALLKTVLANESMIHSELVGRFYYDTDVVQGMVFSDGILMNMGTLNFIEAI